MEGARMVDEWPIIERRIPSDRIVLRKTEAAGQLDLDDESEGRSRTASSMCCSRGTSPQP